MKKKKGKEKKRYVVNMTQASSLHPNMNKRDVAMD
jgi:hypothetical protein